MTSLCRIICFWVIGKLAFIHSFILFQALSLFVCLLAPVHVVHQEIQIFYVSYLKLSSLDFLDSFSRYYGRLLFLTLSIKGFNSINIYEMNKFKLILNRQLLERSSRSYAHQPWNLLNWPPKTSPFLRQLKSNQRNND